MRVPGGHLGGRPPGTPPGAVRKPLLTAAVRARLGDAGTASGACRGSSPSPTTAEAFYDSCD
jgi:hypothetical protein